MKGFEVCPCKRNFDWLQVHGFPNCTAKRGRHFAMEDYPPRVTMKVRGKKPAC